MQTEEESVINGVKKECQELKKQKKIVIKHILRTVTHTL